MLISMPISFKVLEKALDASWVRHRVLSSNIANVDTPNYKSYRVEFEEHLRDALGNTGIRLKTTNSRHIGIPRNPLDGTVYRIVRDESTSTRIDGNNVDIDVAMAGLAKNALMYQAFADQITAKLVQLKSVISEGRR